MKKEAIDTKETKKESRLFNIRIYIASFISVITATLMYPEFAYASNDYLQPINKLKTVAISIVAAAGVIVLIYGGVKFAESFQKKDQNGEYAAIYTIVAGGIMIGISALVTALT